MTFERPAHPASRRTGGWVPSVLLCLIVLAAGAGALYYIYSTEPVAERTSATKDTAMLVNTVSPDTGTFRPTIEAMGTVEPAREIILRPRVQGEVIERSDDFTPGGFVEKGDRMVKLDPSDYRHQLKQRRSELQQAKSDLKLERGRQNVAQDEYEMIDGQLQQGAQKDLVLRKPQLTSVQATVESAQAAVDQAQLELDRTTIHAPFDAHILTRDVNVGSQVAAGDRLARLVGLHRYWVSVRVPLSELRWLSLNNGDSDTTRPDVRIRDRNAWPEDTFRTGTIHRQIGRVGEQSRMAEILVEIPDPLSQTEAQEDKPRLLVDAPVKVWIEGRNIPNAVRLNRAYVRDNDTVWVMKEGTLDIREVDVATRDSSYAYIRDGLSGSDRVVTTNLTAVTDGAALRTKPAEESPDPDTTNNQNTQ